MNIVIQNEYLHQFFHSLTSHSERETVRGILRDSKITWKLYWDLPIEAHTHFISCCLWAKYYPTPFQVKKILLEEKRTGPVNSILEHSSWWIKKKDIDALLVKTFRCLSLDEFIKVSKRNLPAAIKYGTQEQLPILIGDPRLAPQTKSLLEERLKGSTNDTGCHSCP